MGTSFEDEFDFCVMADSLVASSQESHLPAKRRERVQLRPLGSGVATLLCLAAGRSREGRRRALPVRRRQLYRRPEDLPGPDPAHGRFRQGGSHRRAGAGQRIRRGEARSLLRAVRRGVAEHGGHLLLPVLPGVSREQQVRRCEQGDPGRDPLLGSSHQGAGRAGGGVRGLVGQERQEPPGRMGSPAGEPGHEPGQRLRPAGEQLESLHDERGHLGGTRVRRAGALQHLLGFDRELPEPRAISRLRLRGAIARLPRLRIRSQRRRELGEPVQCGGCESAGRVGLAGGRLQLRGPGASGGQRGSRIHLCRLRRQRQAPFRELHQRPPGQVAREHGARQTSI